MCEKVRRHTVKALARLPCAHCGAPSSEQWRKDFCSDDHKVEWVPLCFECDIELNRLLLTFFKAPDAARIMARYIESKK